jgi:hypothetical protein
MLADAGRLSRGALRALVRRCRRDPAFFAREVLGLTPWSRQVEIVEAVRDHKRVGVRSGHGIGKTWSAACLTLWFLYSFPPAIVVTLAPTWRQVRSVLWAEIRRQHRLAPVPLLGRPGHTLLELAENWYATGISTNTPERLQGIHGPHVLVVLDEAPGLEPTLFEAAEGILTGRHSRLLAIGNPTTAAGPFFDAFDSKLYHCLHVSSLEAVGPGLVNPDWIEERRSEWGESSPIYQARVLGEFPAEGAATLLSRAEVRAALSAPPPAVLVHHRLGLDVARFGDDESVLAVVAFGPGAAELVALKAWRGADLMATAAEAQAAIREYSVAGDHVVVDDTGLGGGVVDRLAELGHEVTAVNFGSRARDRDRYSNARAELMFDLARFVRAGKLRLLDDQVLVDELAALRYEIRADGRVAVVKGKRRSPDRAEALALALRDTPHPGVYTLEAAAGPGFVSDGAAGVVVSLPSHARPQEGLVERNPE